jgi:acetoin utilization deacetylase AcuC-like enzyme
MEGLTNNNLKEKTLDFEEIPMELAQENKTINQEKSNKNQTNEKEYENNSDEILKSHYTIDEISENENEEKSESQQSKTTIKKSSLNNKDKLFLELINYVKQNEVDSMNELIKSSNSHHLINRTSVEGFTPIQYAVLEGNLEAFIFLVNNKAQLDKEVEGLYLIHLSLVHCIFDKFKERCSKIFHYIYENFPDQREIKDRLGRTFLHIIFQYDFGEALENINIDRKNLFDIDNNGDFVINYVYIYNSKNCFYKIVNGFGELKSLYLEIRNRFLNHSNISFQKKEKFLENCFLHHSFDIIGFLVLNSYGFAQEIMEDIKNIIEYYEYFERNPFPVSKSVHYNAIVANECIKKMLNNELDRRSYKFDFKYDIGKTAILYDSDCIKHIQLPDDPIKHMQKRAELFENSDRLACLISEYNGVIFSDVLYNSRENDIKDVSKGVDSYYYFLKESKRRTTLNDILKCHDIEYIKKLKDKCDSFTKENTKNKKDHSSKNYHHSNNNNNIHQNPTSFFNYEQWDCDTYINKYTYENIFNTTGCVFDAVDLVINKKCKNALALVRPPGHHAGYFGAVENPITISNGFCIVNNVAIAAAYTKYTYRDIIKKIAIVDFDVHHGNGTEEIIQMLNHKKFSTMINSDKLGTMSMSQEKKINWLDWDDAKNVLFISAHIYNEQNPKTFYPYSGGTETNTLRIDEIYPGGILNIPFGFKNNYSYDYRNMFRTKIIPRLYKFKPDIILVSAGFDGHELEIINQNHMLLQEYDYAWMTEQLQRVANKFCEGRLVSVLEGGYNVNKGLISSFAQSVFTHARFLNLAINTEYYYDVNFTKIKRKRALENDIKVFKGIKRFDNNPRRSERLRHNEIKENGDNKKKNKIEDDKNEIMNNEDDFDEDENKSNKNSINQYEIANSPNKNFNNINNYKLENTNFNNI